ncbi:DUF192 domain-containing protein [Ancylobacter radicis]|uniref:DUF192 domain-containing protein n=1 Tax=Ancylobacter radicis TaxID=2836179 RepID=A0ABS5R4F9_9HYPH|nr:DUF192 domain-containing protein [Ancylobacter radicis]MBS9476516.1 DUF192 domain-containing protein [Ancylobacter radicis]
MTSRSLPGAALIAAAPLRGFCILLFLLGMLAAATVTHAASFDPLTINTRTGPIRFTVEMATTPAERSKGLMYRTELAPDAGMLFDFNVDQPVYMWMKNTYIPLDMLFIRSDGRIASITTDTVPLSTETISSGVSVRAVLELPAGTVRARGIAVGDMVEHRLFARP